MIKFNMHAPSEVTAIYSAGGGTMTLTLKVPTTAERMTLTHLAKLLSTKSPEYEAMLRSIAETWWIAFTGACDETGEAIPDTSENRLKLLQMSMNLTSFVMESLTAESDKVAEGKTNSVSA